MTPTRRRALCLALSALVTWVLGYQLTSAQTGERQARPARFAQPGRISPMHQRQHELLSRDAEASRALPSLSATPCVAGLADVYPCENVDLLAYLPLEDIGGGRANDVWGWTDPATGSEYVLLGRTNGMGVVDISDPTAPVYLGNLPTASGNSTWRDIKVHAGHAFVVSEASGHGMQVFDLSRLAGVTAPPVTFTADARYRDFSNAHNIVINEDSGFAYAVGTNTCNGGLHAVDIAFPTAPVFAGCFAADGYVHDAHCVDYAGPDPDHQSAEICVNAAEDTVTIVDVSDKASPVQISRTGYAGTGYTHQGWLTDDHRWYLLDDELDETSFGHDTRTRALDVSDLDDPQVVTIYTGSTTAIDHNLYVVGDRAYQANYRAGLRVLDISELDAGVISEIGYLDVYPDNDDPRFNGAWSVYPYFPSGVVAVSGIEQGLFVLRPEPGLSLDLAADATTVSPGEAFQFTVTLANRSAVTETFALALALLVPGNPAPVLLFGPAQVTLSPEASIAPAAVLPIPSGAPAGTYIAVGLTLSLPQGAVLEQDAVSFDVVLP